MACYFVGAEPLSELMAFGQLIRCDRCGSQVQLKTPNTKE